MVTINLRNIEEILCRNYKLRKELPEFKSYFDQWSLAQQHSFLKQMGKQAIIDLLNNLNENHAKIISNHFGVPVTIDKFSNRVVRQYETNVNSLQEKMNEIQDQGNPFLYRKGDQVYISTWR